MDADRIEGKAVLEIEKEIDKYDDVLKSGIKKGDKDISWDGFIYVFNNGKWDKENLETRINVQVKGHCVKRIKKGNSKFSIEIADLKNYKKDGRGTLLLVVEMTETGEKKIYYANLLPVDLEEIFEDIKEKQKTKTITVKPIAEKSTSSLKNVCLNFLANSKLQLGTKVVKEEDLKKFKNITKYEFKVISGKEEIGNYLLNNEIYPYAYIGDFRVALPKERIDTIIKPIKKEIKINGKLYYKNYQYKKTIKNEYLEMGKGIVFDINNNEVNLKLQGNVYEILNDIDFFLNILKYQYVYIGKERIELPMRNDIKFSIDNIISDWEKEYNELNKIKETFENFGIDFLQNFNELSKKDIINIHSIMYKKEQSNITQTGIYYLEVGNYTIAIFALVGEDKKIKLYNLFSDLSNVVKTLLLDDDKQEFLEDKTISMYVTLTKEQILSYSNFNADIIKKSFENIKLDEEKESYIVNFILEILKAYDEKPVRKELLVLAEYIAEIVIKFNKNDINTINKIQIIKRKRDITIEEENELYSIKEKDADDKKIQCAIAILLENKTDFSRNFNQLSEEERNDFSNYPIYNLSKNRKG